MAEPFTLYKLIILYMLDRVDFPLTNSQISSFLLDRGYTNYFTLQQAFSELEEANLVKPQTIRNTTQFQLTKSGREALGYFCDRIPNAIQEEADQYLQEHKIELRNEVSVTADYYRTTAKEYAVHCVIKVRSDRPDSYGSGQKTGRSYVQVLEKQMRNGLPVSDDTALLNTWQN